MKIEFRKYNSDIDLNYMYEISSDAMDRQLLFDPTSFNTLEKFEKYLYGRLAHHYQDFFIVTDLYGKQVGYVASYNYCPNDGVINFLVFVDKEHRGSAYGGAIAAKFIDFLFSYYSLRKVYSDVYEYNEASCKANLAFGLEEETRLKEYRYKDGRYWDVVYFVMDREKFYKIRQKYVRAFGN